MTQTTAQIYTITNHITQLQFQWCFSNPDLSGLGEEPGLGMYSDWKGFYL